MTINTIAIETNKHFIMLAGLVDATQEEQLAFLAYCKLKKLNPNAMTSRKLKNAAKRFEESKTHNTAKGNYQADFIREKLKTNDKWLIKGLVSIYALQTESEKANGNTVEDNGVGFSGVDGEFLSSLAEQYNRKSFLSGNQIKFARKCMLKYAGQLTKIANGMI